MPAGTAAAPAIECSGKPAPKSCILRSKVFTVVQYPQLPLPTSQRTTSRLFSISSLASAAQVAPAKAPSASVHQKKPDPPGNTKKTPPRAESSPTYNLAKAVRQRASAVTETYVAYGACESLVKECAAQADYSIPQSREKGVEIPKTKDGEDLGVGKGWWYEGIPQSHVPAFTSIADSNQPRRARSDSDLQHLGASYLPPHVFSNRTHAMFPAFPCSGLAPTPPGPLLLQRRRAHDGDAQRSRASGPQQIPERPVRPMAGSDRRLRRGDHQGRCGAGGGGVAERVQGGRGCGFEEAGYRGQLYAEVSE